MTWSFFGGKKSGKRNKSKRQGSRSRSKQIAGRTNRFEQLETRNLLAVFHVNTTDDAPNTNATLTLREALAVAEFGSTSGTITGLGRVLNAGELAQIDISSNSVGTNDNIQFVAALNGQTILLSAGQLSVGSPVTIDGSSAGSAGIIINAQTASRVFDMTDEAGDVAIKKLTLTNGVVAGIDGGAIRWGSLGTLTVIDSVITGSQAQLGGGIFAEGNLVLSGTTVGGTGPAKNTATGSGTYGGGGIYAGSSLTLTNSLITGNLAGGGTNGGGVFSKGEVTLSNSRVSGNTAAAGSRGGGIYSAAGVTLQNSIIGGIAASDGNTASYGGGIFATNVTVQNSLVASNVAPGTNASNGGGIFTTGAAIVRNSTISGNRTDEFGGGIYSSGTVTLQNATVSNNKANEDNEAVTTDGGGGLFSFGKLTIHNSIIVNNTVGGGGKNPDVAAASVVTSTIKYSLIGIDRGVAGDDIPGFAATGPDAKDANFNIIGNDGGLAVTQFHAFGPAGSVLADNGGASPTIALASSLNPATNSRAINAGRNQLAVSLGLGDQRGLPYARISPLGGTVDMGAFEVQTPPLPATPTSVTIQNQTATVGVLFSFNASPPFSAALTGSLLFSISRIDGSLVSPPGTLPAWLSFNTTTGVLSGTPTPLDAGAIMLRITATNQAGGTASGQFTLTAIIGPDISVQVNGVEIPTGGTAASVGTTSTTINVPGTIQNTGSTTLNLTGTPRISVSGANPGDFVVTTQPAVAAIAGGGSTAFAVAFTPTANGLRTATLTILSDDPDESPYVITLQGTGTGIAATVPDINVQVNGVNVATAGTADVGTTATTISVPVNIQNAGSNTLNLTGTPRIAVSGANASDFVVTTQPAAGIAAGSNSIATVAFTPSANGLRTAVLTIASNDPDENPYTINLQGTGAGVVPFAPFTEDFNDGVADPKIIPQSGTWAVVNNEFQATRTPGTNAVTIFNLGALPATGVTVQTTLRVNPTSSTSAGRTFSNGFIVFDYVDALNFKIAGIEAANDLLVVSQVVGGVYQRLAFRGAKTKPGVNYTLRAVVTANAVTVTLNGTTSLSQSFAANLLDGPVGVATINADTTFDNFSVTG